MSIVFRLGAFHLEGGRASSSSSAKWRAVFVVDRRAVLSALDRHFSWCRFSECISMFSVRSLADHTEDGCSTEVRFLSIFMYGLPQQRGLYCLAVISTRRWSGRFRRCLWRSVCRLELLKRNLRKSHCPQHTTTRLR